MKHTHMTICASALALALVSPSFAQSTQTPPVQTLQTAGVSGSADRTPGKVYDVTVRGDRNDRRDDVYDKALYKAAKATRKKDYDWFRVLSSDVERDRERRSDRAGLESEWERVPVRECGLLTCRTEYRTQRRSTFEYDDFEREITRYSVTLRYEMGWGAMPADGHVYDARDAKRRYK